MFGTYNVISLVVLLNMLIAMMNNSYQLIAVSSLLYKGDCLISRSDHVGMEPIGSSMKQSVCIKYFTLAFSVVKVFLSKATQFGLLVH